MRYTKLTDFHKERRLFDPKKKQDLQELKHLLFNGKWKNGCPFYLEDPWDDVVSMCKHKFTVAQLEKI